MRCANKAPQINNLAEEAGVEGIIEPQHLPYEFK